MRPELREAVVGWMDRASRDILAADRSLHGVPRLSEMTAYHAQQAVEKALKAFITRHQQDFPRSHDLLTLVNRCVAIQPAFEKFRGMARDLNPYVSEFRYPDGPIAPPDADAELALELARELVKFVYDELGLEPRQWG